MELVDSPRLEILGFQARFELQLHTNIAHFQENRQLLTQKGYS